MQLSAEWPGGKYSFLKNGAGEAIQPPKKSALVKRKALYFLRSTVLFWWRIAGSNR